MSKKYILIILTCIWVCVIGCGKKQDGDIQLPDIVFVNTIRYGETYIIGEPQSAIMFYDKKGNYYFSEDEYVCQLSFEELVREHAEGKLSDKISFRSSCDTGELLENYKKLCELSKDEFEIVYPKYGPDVIADKLVWYGLYYDRDGNLQSLRIHERDAHGNHYADDERVNEIYEWYLSTFQK